MKRICLSDSGQVLKAVYVRFTRESEKLRLVGGDRIQRRPDKWTCVWLRESITRAPAIDARFIRRRDVTWGERFMQRRKKRAAANPPPRGRQQQQPPPPPQPQVQPQQQQLPPQLARPSAIHREIQTFYGGAADEVDSWFLHLYLAALQQWDEATKLREAVAALGPGVRREYAAFEVITRPARVGWAEFERYMRTTYGPKQPVDFWTTRLMNIKQATQEAMKDYISRFRLMSTSLVQAEQADGDGGRVSQRMLIVWFKHGLRPEFQLDLIRAEPIATLTDACQAAEKAEVVWKALLKRPHPLGEVYASHPAAIDDTPERETA